MNTKHFLSGFVLFSGLVFFAGNLDAQNRRFTHKHHRHQWHRPPVMRPPLPIPPMPPVPHRIVRWQRPNRCDVRRGYYANNCHHKGHQRSHYRGNRYR